MTQKPRPQDTPEFYAGYGKDVRIPGWPPIRIHVDLGNAEFTGTAEEHEALMREVFKGEAK